MNKANRVLTIASRLASRPDFQSVRGPGDGDRHTADFMRQLRMEVAGEFGTGTCEQAICGETGFKVDFYFRDEATVVEVALGLQNPNTEFEKDILKAILAQDLGYPVRTLFFIGRAGAVTKCAQPGRMAVRRLIETKHGISTEVHELPGEPRTRARNRARDATVQR